MQGKSGNGSVGTLVVQIALVFWVASNLRAPITSVGPVISSISADLSLSNFQSSLITSIPLLMFAFCSVAISRFATGFSINSVLLFGLIILGLGTVLRINFGVPGLMIGSVLTGLGISIGNVITPGYIKSRMPQLLGLMTGLFAVAMNLTAAFASAYSIKIGQWLTGDWKGSLGIWVSFTVLAIIVVMIDAVQFKRKQAEQSTKPVQSRFNMFRSRQAWNISVFMGLQSVVYYSVVSWLPTVLKDYGMAIEETGWVLFTFQIATLPITFLGPVLANRMKHQQPLIVFVVVLMLASIILFATGSLSTVYFAAVLLGISNGLAFSLSLLFFAIRTQSSAHAIKLSGMAQSVGYLIAAAGPPVFGLLHQNTHSWSASFYFLIACVIAVCYFGWQSAKNKFVED
jgi:CP family cyanate transporter-like MFS transporter